MNTVFTFKTGVTRMRAGLTGVVMFAVAGSLSGCGGVDGVQFEGALFEMAGLTDIGKKTSDKKMKDRAPLVIPPSTSLISPGEADQVAIAGQQNWPVDPDQRKIAMAKHAEAEKERRCREGIFAKGAKPKAEDFEQLSQGNPGCNSILHKIINKPLQQPDPQ